MIKQVKTFKSDFWHLSDLDMEVNSFLSSLTSDNVVDVTFQPVGELFVVNVTYLTTPPVVQPTTTDSTGNTTTGGN